MSALALSDLRPISGREPALHDLRLAEALGFQRPRAIRQIITRNAAELARYGEISSAMVAAGARGGRPTQEYWLNEGQALLICMFSDTEKAADVRQQVITVFMAWRQGKTPPAPAAGADAFVAMAVRVQQLEKVVGFIQPQRSVEIAHAATHLPIWTHGRRPGFWEDHEVRLLLTQLHRQVPLKTAMLLCQTKFGTARTPHFSSIQRYWARLDAAFKGPKGTLQ